MKKIKYFLPSILLMVIIFSFSNQTGEQSGSLSSMIVLWIQNNLHITIPEIFIRKTAHMCEYAVLCFTYIYGFYKSGFSIKQIILFSISCSFLYACSDEIHQLFIGGRAGMFTDVLIDTSGAIISTILYYIFYKYTKKQCS